MADVLGGDLVPDEHHERLEQVVPALRDQGSLAGGEPDHDQQDARREPHVDDVLGDVQADVAIADPESQRHHPLVLDVMKDVLGDVALVLVRALVVLRLVGAGGHLLMARMLVGCGRGVRHRRSLPVCLRLRLGDEDRREEEDHGVAPCGRELACTNSTSITWVAA